MDEDIMNEKCIGKSIEASENEISESGEAIILKLVKTQG
jgi:hypothetical protein